MVDISVDGMSSDISVIVDASSQPMSVTVTSHERPSFGRHSSREIDTDTSAETSTNGTPSSRTSTATVVVNGRERSGTIIGRPVWDEPHGTNLIRSRPLRTRTRMPTSPDESTDNSRPETETEDDGDADVDMDQSQDTDDTTGSAHVTLPRAPRPPARSMTQRRRTVGIIADGPETAPLEVNADAHIIINHGQGGGVDGEGVGVVGVEDGIVSLEPNDDFAMGAPPGAPGALDETTPRNMLGMDAPVLDRRARTAPDATPRATVVALPPSGPAAVPGGTMFGGAAGVARDHAAAQPVPIALGRTPSHVHHHRDADSGPYKDEDVLLSLQLLAYLSKYPHVRQAFYKQRVSFHPAAANLPANRAAQQPVAGPSTATAARTAPPQPAKESHSFFRAFASATARGKEKEKAPAATTSSGTTGTTTTTSTTSPRMTNVFSLVERFTFRPSSSENDLPNPPPKLPPEIQYWAGVIMRNACRKDDSRGGIRQCANSESLVSTLGHSLANLTVFQCFVVNGNRILESLPSVGDVERQSIAERNARVRHGVRDIGFGAAPKTERTLRSSRTIMCMGWMGLMGALQHGWKDERRGSVWREKEQPHQVFHIRLAKSNWCSRTYLLRRQHNHRDNV